MASFADRFKDPRWLRRRDEIIAAADYQCQDCGAADTLEVHICYFEKGCEPWEYPDEAYRCICAEDRAIRRPLEKELRKIFASFTAAELDILHGALLRLSQVEGGAAPCRHRATLCGSKTAG
jgi:hypothetical protein